jgi:uncharacterized protein (DUF1015 family)
MVQIAPFKGIRYDPDKVEIKGVVAPPYDVINEEERDGFYDAHDRNVIRLILGKEYPADTDESNRYTRARDHFNQWQDEGVLAQDGEPSLYVYELEYKVNGQTKRMRGLICLLKLVDFAKGEVLPHEETLKKPKADRLNLMRTMGANDSQIFTFYSDPEGNIDSKVEGALGTPEAEVADSDGVIHRMWKIDDPVIISGIVGDMKDRKLYIADGHHRYETSLALSKEMKGAGYDHTLVFMTNMDASGMTILPAHRIISGLEDFHLEGFLSALDENFMVEEVGDLESMMNTMRRLAKEQRIFGLYCQGKYWLLTLMDEGVMDEKIPDKSTPWRRLNVTILHTLIMKDLLGVIGDENKSYEIDEEKVVEAVDSGKYQLGLFLNPTMVDHVRDVALAGEKMPGKATYFYPKLLTGLVMRKIE